MSVQPELPVVRVAAVQATPVILDLDASVAKAVGLIAEAAAQGAQLVVFPETFLSLYPSYAWAHLPASGSQADEFWERFWGSSVAGRRTRGRHPGGRLPRARRTRRHRGERARGRPPGSVYNSLLLLGPDGLLSRHRKLMPTHHERLFHGVGAGDDLGVTETPIGRLGGLICWENRMPLARWAVYQGGPQIWLAPTADDSDGWLATVRHIAIEAGAYVVVGAAVHPAHGLPRRLPVAAARPRGARPRRRRHRRAGVR